MRIRELIMKVKFKTLGTALFSVSLAGCGFSLIDTQPPPQIYDLTAPDVSTAGDAVTWQLIVEEPSTIRALGTNRIALRRSDNSIQYYQGTRWSDRGPRLFQARVIEALEDTGRIMSVGGETSGLNAKFRLKSNLRDFHAEVGGGGAPTVSVTLSAKLLNARSREVMATTLIEKKVKAGSGKIDAVVSAFDEAVQAVAGEAATWVLETGEAQEG